MHPEHTPSFVATRRSRPLPADLPSPLTSFVGRRRELAEVERCLAGHRLVTLLGPAGSGKTRLAIEAAARARARHRDGVYFVELSRVARPALVASHVALSVGVREVTGRPLGESLLEWFAYRNVLLVLDNCEHVLAAGAELMRPALELSPNLTVLATSREPLRIGGEVELRLSPLSLPRTPQPSPREVLASEAGRLFFDRAALVRPGYRITPETAPTVAAICRRLDGIPLAIELAITWFGTLSEHELLAQLDDRFRLLTGGRSGGARHQTLKAALDWSYDLLSEAERLVFARASVFTGGFTVNAAEAVCAGRGVPKGDVLDLLRRLVDKSLVVAGRSRLEQSRYTLLETIKDYAGDRLEESAEARATRARHARHFLSAAQTAAVKVGSPAQSVTLDQLEREQGNFRGALDWALASEPALALELANALVPYWNLRGPLSEAQRWLSAVLAQAPAPTPARANALRGSSAIAWKRGEFEAAQVLAEEGLRLARATGDETTLLRAILQLSVVLHSIGELERSLALAEESLSLARGTGDLARLSGALWAVGITRYFSGDTPGASQAFEEQLEVAQSLGEPFAMARARRSLGLIEMDAGRLDRARSLFTENLRTLWRVRDLPTVAYALDDHGLLAFSRGRYDRGLRLVGAAAALRETLGVRPVRPWQDKVAAAIVAARRAAGARARGWHEEGSQMAVEHAIAYALGTRSHAPERPAERGDGPSLSEREGEVVRLLVQGFTNRLIADRLGIGERTVDSHVDHVRDKLGVRTRAQIASWATAREEAVES